MKASPSAQRRTERRALERRLQQQARENPGVMWSLGVHRDVMRYARLRGSHPFWRKRPERMAGK